MRLLVSLCFTAWFYLCSFAQEPGFKLFTTKDGLVGNQVWGITQDVNGFLWLATTQGVSRFDGLKFKNFTKNDGLTNSVIIDIESVNDTIFVLGKNSIDVIVRNSVIKYYTAKNIRNIKYFRIKERLYVYCQNVYNSRFLAFDVLAGRYVPYLDNVLNIRGNDAVYTTSSESYKLINGKIYRLGLKWPLNNPVVNISLNENEIKDVFVTNNGNVYIITKTGKAYNSPSDKLLLIDKTGCVKKKYDLLSLNNVNGFSAVLPVSDKVLVLLDLRGNIYLLNEENIYKINYNFFVCVKIISDREGNIWICSDRGLVKLFYKGFLNFPVYSGYPQYVWGVFPENTDKTWFTSYSSGLHCYEGGKNIKTISKIDGLVLYPYYGAVKGFNNDVFIPDAHGVVIFDLKSQRFRLIKCRENDPVSLTTLDDAEKKVLFAIRTDLFIMNQDYSFDSVCSIKKFGSGRSVLAVARRNDNYYIACSGDILEYNLLTKSGKWFNLENVRFNSIASDFKNNLWAASDEGIFFFSSDGSNVRFFNKNNFLALIIDRKNCLFAVDFKGLYRLDLNLFYKTGQPDFEFYGKDEGFSGAGDQNAFFLDDDGNLWLPGVENSVKIITSQLGLKKIVLHPLIEDVLASDKKNVFISLQKSSEHILKYKYKNICFNFLAVCLSTPEKVRYQYRLVGYDDSWSEPSDKREANYTNLAPGNYVFELRASTTTAFNNAEITRFYFRITPPFWLTWWFKIISLFAFIALVILVFYWQMKRIKKQAHLKHKMAQLEMELLGMQIEPHFVGNSLEVIKNFIRNNKIDQAINAIDDFGGLLRSVAVLTRKNCITLEEELRILDLYVKFQKLRFGDAFVVEVTVDLRISTLEILVPPLIMQPFVENSIKHGLQYREGNGLIKINIEKINSDYIVIAIFDNGIGRINSRKIEDGEKRQSIGIANSEERLRIFNDTEGKVIEINDKPDGMEVLLWINIRK